MAANVTWPPAGCRGDSQSLLHSCSALRSLWTEVIFFICMSALTLETTWSNEWQAGSCNACVVGFSLHGDSVCTKKSFQLCVRMATRASDKQLSGVLLGWSELTLERRYQECRQTLWMVMSGILAQKWDQDQLNMTQYMFLIGLKIARVWMDMFF